MKINFQLLFFLKYIHPTDSHKLGQAELVCIDEAAAIPLPLVKNLLGPYLVFMSSTINGWGVIHISYILLLHCTLILYSYMIILYFYHHYHFVSLTDL